MTSAATAEEPLSASGANRWMIALAVSTGALMEIVDTSIVNVALNDMQAQMGASLSAIGWVVTSYAVANVIILPLSAWLGDVFGRKRYFVFSLMAFTLASIACGVANSLSTLIVARVLQGLFGGGLLAKAQSILFETFPREEQAKAQALFGAVVIAGPAIGPVLGGYLVTNLTWRWIFFVNLPVGIIATLMCALYLPDDGPFAGIKGTIDWLAIASLSLGLGCLQTVLEEGQTEDWFSSNFIRWFAVVSAVNLAFFIYRSFSVPEPLVNLRVLRYRSLWSGCIVSFLVGAALYCANFAVPIFAQNIMHLTSEQTGLMLLSSAIASAVGMPMVGALVGRFDPRQLVFCGVCVCAAMSYLLSGLATETSREWFFWPLTIRGFGIVMIFLPVNLATLGPIPKKDMAASTGLFSLVRQLGGSMGIAAMTAMLERRGALHRSHLLSHLGEGDLLTNERLRGYIHNFQAMGWDINTARQKALASLDGLISLQGSILSFGDIMILTSGVFVLMVPFIFLLEKPDPRVKVSMGH